jgi:large subunit ribosomal protein L3
MQGLIGKKLGMTQVYDGNGHRVAVTMIEAGPCLIVQRKTKATDGYDAVQIGFGSIKEKQASRAMAGHFKKAGADLKAHLCEMAVDAAETAKAGDALDLAVFEGVKFVDISGLTKGKGFQGVVRRYGMRGGPMTHGSHSKRRIGSIGSNSYPARVHRGHRMPGHQGQVPIVQQNLRIVEMRPDQNMMLVEGAVPGAVGCIVVVRKAIKKTGKI